MSDLKDLLHGAGEAKRELFANEDFVGGYGRSVVSRVKRRRVVSATAMGGGTVVAIGAIAAGAANVPWSSFVMGASPAGSPLVVCTTTTPDAVAGPDVSVPPGATMAFLDNTTGDVAFGAELNSGATVWYNGQVVGTGEDGHPIAMTFPSGETFEFTPTSTGGGGLFEGSDVSLLPISDYLEQFAPVATLSCVTMTPEPTGSPSPDPSGPAITSPTASPSTSSDAPIVASPFQCGSELASDEYGTAQLSIGDVEWLTADEVNAQLNMSYMGGKAPYGATGSGPVARVIVSDTRPLRSGEQIGITTSDASDPVETETSASLDDAQGRAVAVLGTNFVAVRDGVVVATVPGDLGDQDHAISLEPNTTDLGVTATFLNPDGAFTACSGETLGTDWDLYAVAGQLFAYPDGSADEPIYAWHKIDPAN